MKKVIDITMPYSDRYSIEATIIGQFAVHHAERSASSATSGNANGLR